MGEETLKRVLKDFGLTETEAEVYLFLAKHGALKGTEVARQIKKDKAQVYHILKSLQTKGLVESTLEAPVRFTTVPFENIVESTIKAKRDEAERIESTKHELLNYWKNITKTKLEMPLEKFRVIEGRPKVYSKISQMIAETKNQLSTITTVTGLLRADQFGLYDTISKQPSKSTIQFRFLTDLSSQNLRGIKILLRKMHRRGLDFRGRNTDLGQSLFPRMVIRDNEETLFFITPRTSPATEEHDDLCLWTNCRDLVKALSVVFEDMWHNSTEIQKKIAEIEIGKATSETRMISDSEAVCRKHDEALRLAEKEVVAITSQKGLIDFCNNKHLLRNWVQRGVRARIMAPITSENVEKALQLSRQFEIRHIPTGHLETTVIDGKKLFQFKSPPLFKETPNSIPSFENAFCTDDFNYVEKTRIMLDYIWNKAQALSTMMLKPIAGSAQRTADPASENPAFRATQRMVGTIAVEDKAAGKELTETAVIEKMIRAKKTPASDGSESVVRLYSTNMQAFVRASKALDLPDMLFHVYHLEKSSTYGAEDVMLVHLGSDTPAGYAYVLVAVATDNLEAVDFWRRCCSGTPAAQNIQLLNRDELEVRIRGNTFFAGWTVQIPLVAPYTLPPACLLIEGYGEVKTNAYIVHLPSGYTLKTQGNVLEAFVTLYHPMSKYSGPGTDGGFGRDIIMEFYPP